MANAHHTSAMEISDFCQSRSLKMAAILASKVLEMMGVLL
jgi:hypothetical protein